MERAPMLTKTMQKQFFVFLVCMICLCGSLPTRQKRHHNGNHANHGGIKMGVLDVACDNAMVELQRDWDNTTDYEYTCQSSDVKLHPKTGENRIEWIEPEAIPDPIHKCMHETIVYEDLPPRGGPHRPIWPVFGEYTYVPPQRWVHSLEHGAAVFLYHPCADKQEVQKLRNLATACLWRHIITPYRQLPNDMPFAVVTWGSRLMMGDVNEKAVVKFVRENALHTYESLVIRDGDYPWALVKKAEIVSDIHDAEICPHHRIYVEKDMFDHDGKSNFLEH